MNRSSIRGTRSIIGRSMSRSWRRSGIAGAEVLMARVGVV